MQDWRFDDLTRTLGRATSRRQVMKGLLAGVVTAVVGRSIRIPGVAAAAPTCNGVPYDPSTQCCEPAGIQPRYPIANLDLCPNRVPHPGHTPSFNGCGPENGFVKYLIPNRIGPFRNVDFTPACNNHDICYDTCNSVKSVCDTNFFNDLSAQCAAAYPGTSWYQTYMRTACINVDARIFYLAVSQTPTGRAAYEDAQKGACDCCPVCENCDGPNDMCCHDQCIDTSNDPNNCGACDHTCDVCQVCDGGQCVAKTCAEGTVCCQDNCVTACPQGKTLNPQTCTCECSQPCPPGQLQDPETCACQDLCANVTCAECQTCDPTSGDCVPVADQTPCGTGQVCCSGVCQQTCDCPDEQLCSANPDDNTDAICCSPNQVCGYTNWDQTTVGCCEQDRACDVYCCQGSETCLNDSVCCPQSQINSAGECCQAPSLVCGDVCCNANNNEVCANGVCCNNTMIDSNGDCCHTFICSNGECCGQTQICGSISGEPQHCIDATPV